MVVICLWTSSKTVSFTDDTTTTTQPNILWNKTLWNIQGELHLVKELKSLGHRTEAWARGWNGKKIIVVNHVRTHAELTDGYWSDVRKTTDMDSDQDDRIARNLCN